MKPQTLLLTAAYSNGLGETYRMNGYTDVAAAGPEFDTEHVKLMSQIDSYQTITKDGTTTASFDITQYVDGFGNILRQVRFDGVNLEDVVELQYRYDALKRPLYEVDADQNTVTAAYDPWGRMIETTDPLGNLYRNEYDRATRKFTSYLVGWAI